MYSGISVRIRVYPYVLGYLNDLLLEMTDTGSLFNIFSYRFVQTTQCVTLKQAGSRLTINARVFLS